MTQTREPARRSQLFAGLFGLAVVAGCAPGAPAEAPPKVEASNVPVAMYMTEWCPVCRHARDWLNEGGYSFVEHDVERDPRAAVFFVAVNPRGSVPTFDVGGEIVIGFDPDQLREAIVSAARERGVKAPPPSMLHARDDGEPR